MSQGEKKKKKRKRKSGKKLAVASTSEDNIDHKNDLDDIDKTVRWVEASDPSSDPR